MKRITEIINEEESKTTKVTKDDFKYILSAIISNFKKDSFVKSKENAARAFIILHSFIGNTIPEKEKFPEDKLEKLYNALFSNYEDDKVELPKFSYNDWEKRVTNILQRDNNSITIEDFESINEESRFHDAFTNLIKGLAGNMITAGLVGTIGTLPASMLGGIASVGVNSVMHVAKKKGYSMNDIGTKFLDVFRDTIDKVTNDMCKSIKKIDYTVKQVEDINKIAGNINAWWNNLNGVILSKWNTSDSQAAKMMNVYSNALKDIENTEFDNNNSLQNITSDDIEAAMNALIDNINLENLDKNDDIKENEKKLQELVKSFCLFSMMSSELIKINPKLKDIESKVKRLYELLFSKYNEYGKKLEEPIVNWEDLKSFFDSREKYYSSLKKKPTEVKESETVETENAEIENPNKEKIENVINKSNLSDKEKNKLRKDVSKLETTIKTNSKEALQDILFDTSYWLLDVAAASSNEERARKAGDLLGKMVSKFATKFAERTTNPLVKRALGNIGNSWIKKEMEKVWNDIKSLFKKNKEEIQKSIENSDVDDVKKIGKIINANKLVHEKYVLRFDEFLNENEKYKSFKQLQHGDDFYFFDEDEIIYKAKVEKKEIKDNKIILYYTPQWDNYIDIDIKYLNDYEYDCDYEYVCTSFNIAKDVFKNKYGYEPESEYVENYSDINEVID